MVDPELVHALDYILNRSDEKSIEAVAAAVVRRRRELTMFGGVTALPDPRRLAKELSSQLKMEDAIESLEKNIRDYAMRSIRQEAPELTEAQVKELAGTWIPVQSRQSDAILPQKNENPRVPKDLLASMVDQFIAFSLGRMEEREDQALRKEMGPWPDKYWKSFPRQIRLIIADFLKGAIEEKDFDTRIGMVLSV